MNALTDISALNTARVVAAYLLAVTSASLVFVLSHILLEIPNIFIGVGFESATAFDMPTKFMHLAVMTAFLFAIGWVFSFVTALVPFVAGIVVARHLAIRHWLYFVLGGALTAIALEPIFISIPNLGINIQAPEPSLYEKYLAGLLHFLISGAAAGMSCFAFLRRGFASPTLLRGAAYEVASNPSFKRDTLKRAPCILPPAQK